MGQRVRLPVVHQTAWVNPGNRPDKATARQTRIAPSVRGSIGGRGVHMTADGIHHVFNAPRMYAPIALAVPLVKPFATPRRVARRRVPGVLLHPPKRSMCPLCGLWFESKKTRGQHQYGCSKEGAD